MHRCRTDTAQPGESTGEALMASGRTRKHPLLRNYPSNIEYRFCSLLALGHSVEQAAVKLGFRNPEQGYKLLKRPRVEKLLGALQERVQEQFLERASQAVIATFTLATERLAELLAAPRIGPLRSVLAKMAVSAAVKAGMDQKEIQRRIGPEAASRLGLSPAAIRIFRRQKLTIVRIR
jgi:hypothetical protein